MTPEPEPVVLPTLTREQWLQVAQRFAERRARYPKNSSTTFLLESAFGPCPPEPAPYWRCDSANNPIEKGVSVSVLDGKQQVVVSVRSWGERTVCVVAPPKAHEMALALTRAAEYAETHR